ncbi:hypothetical protein [Methylocystis parvus]|nr:hypothetical protein [Methylocystis parvus]WBK00500.1 Uma2 family endonuclease [Methylocystis parvus OBBP]
MTTGEFLAWVQSQPKGNFELFRGEIVSMAPERAKHSHGWIELDPPGLAIEVTEVFP